MRPMKGERLAAAANTDSDNRQPHKADDKQGQTKNLIWSVRYSTLNHVPSSRRPQSRGDRLSGVFLLVLGDSEVTPARETSTTAVAMRWYGS